MREGFRLYDAHAHIGAARHSGVRRSADELLAIMDGGGVDRAMLIPFPVVEDERAAHDEIAAALRAHPDRFSGAACLNPFRSEAEFRDEVRRCAQELGFKALKFQPQYQGLNPVSERSDFLFESARDNGLAVICHTGSGAPFALPSLFIAPARRFPDLRIILGHAGSPIYYLECAVAAQVCPNILIELSSLMPHHILDLMRHVPASRLMIGSDLPASLSAEMGKILDLPICAAEKREILWETPRRAFGD